MPRTALTVNSITRTGLTVPAETTGDVANGNSVANDGRVFLLAHNTNGASTARTLTVHFTATVDGATVSDKTYSIAAGVSKMIGPFPMNLYGSTMTLNVDNAEMKVTAFHI